MRTLVLSALLLVAFPAFASAPLTFEEVDTDGDGLISADEAASVEGLDFNTADGDNDGTLTVDEYEIAVEDLSPPADASSNAESTLPEPVAAPAPAKPAAGGEAATPAPATPPGPAKPPATGGAAPITIPPASTKP